MKQSNILMKKTLLYQRSGFILSYFSNDLHLSDDFFNTLHSKIDKSVCYLTSSKKKEETTFDHKWNISYPMYVKQII